MALLSRGALLSGTTAILALFAGPAWAASPASPASPSAFCAAAALAAYPSPEEQGSRDPAVVAAQLALVRHWMASAVADAAATGQAVDATMAGINRDSGAIHQALSAGRAPFPRLSACEADSPALLRMMAPEGADTLSLDEIADAREVDIYRTSTGRLRPYFAGLTAKDAFLLDMRIVALERAITAGEGGSAVIGHLRLRLAQALFDRRIGTPADNSEHAIAAWRAALASADLAAADRGEALSGLCFAWFARPMGDRADNLERALATCREAQQVLDRADSRLAWAHVQQVLAGVYHDRMRGHRSDNLEAAIAADRAALTVITRQADPTAWALAENNLGAHLSDRIVGEEQDNLEAALAAYRAEGEVIGRETSATAWAILQGNLAPLLIHRERGGLAANQEGVIAALREALGLPALPGYVVASTHYQLGQAYAARVTGEHRANLEEAVRQYRRAILGDAVSGRWPIQVGQALGGALIELGRYEEARDALKIAARAAEAIIGLGIDPAEIRGVTEEAPELYALYALATAKSGQPEEALTILSAGRARLLFTALAANRLKLAAPDMARLAMLRAELERREAMVDAAARGPAPAGAGGTAALDNLESLRAQIVALYEKGASGALQQPSARELAGGGAVVAPVLTTRGSVVLVLASDGSVRAHDAPALTRAGLVGNVGSGPHASWRGGLDPDETDRGLGQLMPALGTSFGAALRAALGEAGVAPGAAITILPDGASALLPVALARDEASGHTLLEDYRVSFAPNLAALAEARQRAARARDRSLALLTPPAGALAYAEIEGSLVERAFAGTRSEAWRSPGTATLMPALAPHGYWHFATHGTFDWSDPRHSGVLTAPGDWLTLADLLDADKPIGAPRLVVLSACDTGLSDYRHNPDEFTGLPSGFLFAGAAGVVASLWPVDDLATSLLMSRFYENHLGRNQPPDLALREAQLWLRDVRLGDLAGTIDAWRGAGLLKPEQAETMGEDARAYAGTAGGEARPFASPRFWGGFVLYGA